MLYMPPVVKQCPASAEGSSRILQTDALQAATPFTAIPQLFYLSEIIYEFNEFCCVAQEFSQLLIHS